MLYIFYPIPLLSKVVQILCNAPFSGGEIQEQEQIQVGLFAKRGDSLRSLTIKSEDPVSIGNIKLDVKFKK